jgi:putative phosphoesterase
MTVSHASRVAVISDVHGNAPALAAVLAEIEEERPELVVFGGDLTWGPLPEETLALVEPLATSAVFVRGNADRAIVEHSTGTARDEPTERARWLVERHPAEARAFLADFVEQTTVDVFGLGPVRFCHGSPRGDTELVTFATPEKRMRALLEGVDERVLVTAHTHVQFDRRIAGVRSVNPGSVGMPYEGRAGAFWALLGPDVELRSTDYDVDETVRRYRASDDPSAEAMVEILLEPPTRDEVAEHAERLEFSE